MYNWNWSIHQKQKYRFCSCERFCERAIVFHFRYTKKKTDFRIASPLIILVHHFVKNVSKLITWLPENPPISR